MGWGGLKIEKVREEQRMRIEWVRGGGRGDAGRYFMEKRGRVRVRVRE